MRSNIWTTAAATTAAAVGAISISYRSSLATVTVLGVGTLILGVLAGIDIATHRLPNPIVAALALYAVTAVVTAGLITGDNGRIVSAVTVGLVFLAIGTGMAFAGMMGMGDAKLGFPIGIAAGWFGPVAVLVTIGVTAATGAIAGLVVIANQGRNTEISYGPFLAMGSVAGVIAASS